MKDYDEIYAYRKQTLNPNAAVHCYWILTRFSDHSNFLPYRTS